MTSNEPIDPTDPPSQSQEEGARVDQLEHDVEGAREQVARHDDDQAPAFIEDGDEGTQYEDNAIAP